MDSDDDYHIEIDLGEARESADATALVDAVKLTLRREGRRSCRISVAIVDDAGIARLHERYLGRPGPTDCLSFDLRDDPESEVVEGEIVVSEEAAGRESRARVTSKQAELTLYVIHGLLHLLGYDDAAPDAASGMHALEDRLLRELGFGAVYGEPES